MLYQLYDGDIDLEFDEGAHVYRVDGEAVDGVTGALSIISKPALIPWAVKMAVNYCKEHIEAGESYDEIQLEEIWKSATTAHRTSSSKAATIGTHVHDWIDKYIKGEDPKEPINKEVRAGVKAFREFVDNFDVEFIDAEQRVYSRKHRFAGTYDFTCKLGGKLMMGDIKTSSGIYDEYFLQLGAYDIARREETGQRFVGHVVVNCTKQGKLNVKTSTDVVKNRKAFLAALELHRALKKKGK